MSVIDQAIGLSAMLLGVAFFSFPKAGSVAVGGLLFICGMLIMSFAIVE